ncbi:twin-arginine translocation signal domain-containing protein [Salinibaculum salinum]|uniref:twin-arginine translocation signal domain-containing protein n=1 Tax=Salinibaculum salinum TaxID=3131996 RepID=UPI0030EE2FB8
MREVSNNKGYGRRDVLKYTAAGVLVAGIGSTPTAAQGRGNSVTLTTSDDPSWITAEVTPKQRTVVSIELDESVYGRWPSNPTSYAMEANIGIVDPETGVSDDFRIGYAGADTGQRDGTAGGYIRRNVDGTRTDYLEEDVQGLFKATESSDQQSYEFVINWNTPLPEAPEDKIETIQVNEVFGSDGGEGVQTEDVDPIAESSDELDL